MAKVLNLLLLIGGYGLGQGALFLAQTWLVSQGELDRLAAFGLSFYLITLAILVVDFGSTSFLAREFARDASRLDQTPHNPWAFYWRVLPIRLAVAAVCVSGLLILQRSDAFAAAYAVFAVPALLIWAFNTTGVLEGLRLSGVSGATAAIPFILSATALVLTTGDDPAVSGAALGASLTIGYGLCVAGQIVALAFRGHCISFVRPQLSEVGRTFVDSGGAMLTLLPGQVYFRLQLALCAAFLTPASTALFLYAKQVVTACAQVIGFLRRVEFPDLVKALEISKGVHPARTTLYRQRSGTFAALLLSFLVFTAAFIAHNSGDGEVREAGKAIMTFTPSIITGTLSLSFIQGLLALRQFTHAGTVMIASTVGGALVSLPLVPALGVSGLAIADVFVNAIAIALAYAALSRYGGQQSMPQSDKR
jgi:hypothetical protein